MFTKIFLRIAELFEKQKLKSTTDRNVFKAIIVNAINTKIIEAQETYPALYNAVSGSIHIPLHSIWMNNSILTADIIIFYCGENGETAYYKMEDVKIIELPNVGLISDDGSLLNTDPHDRDICSPTFGCMRTVNANHLVVMDRMEFGEISVYEIFDDFINNTGHQII